MSDSDPEWGCIFPEFSAICSSGTSRTRGIIFVFNNTGWIFLLWMSVAFWTHQGQLCCSKGIQHLNCALREEVSYLLPASKPYVVKPAGGRFIWRNWKSDPHSSPLCHLALQTSPSYMAFGLQNPVLPSGINYKTTWCIYLLFFVLSSAISVWDNGWTD